MYFQHLCASNDTDGNPRRLYVLVDNERRIAAWDEGYAGHLAVPGIWREQAYKAKRLDITVSLYKELRRTLPGLSGRTKCRALAICAALTDHPLFWLLRTLLMYRNEWFCGRDARRQLPPECVADCSGSGDRSRDVAAWVRRLRFEGPAWLIREHLRGYGAWDSTELCDHQQNLQRLLWIWACNCAEHPGDYDYLYLGN